MGERTLWLGEASWSGAHVTVTYGVDGHRFSTSLWWEGLDLDALAVGGRARCRATPRVPHRGVRGDEGGQPPARPLRPRALCRPRHAALPRALVHRVPPRVGPVALRARPGRLRRPRDRRVPGCARRTARRHGHGAARAALLRRRQGQPRRGAGAGGGRGSLRQLRLLPLDLRPSRAAARPDRRAARSPRAHRAAAALGVRRPPRRAGRSGSRRSSASASVTAAETPASLFGALPLALARGCTELVVAHERSADVGNLVWDRTGEEINHQWGKSLEAERRLARLRATRSSCRAWPTPAC